MKLIPRALAGLAALLCLESAFADLGILQAGATSQQLQVRAIVQSTGAPDTALAYNTSGLSCSYQRPGGSVTSITLATQTVTGAYSSGGFVHLANGWYRLDVPDAAIAAGVGSVLVTCAATGDTFVDGRVALSPAVNAVQVGGQTASASGTVTFPNATLASTTNITAGTITTATNVTTVSSGAISEASFATTAGSFKPFGIVDQGTAQAATATTIQLRSALAMADSTAIGMTVMACGSTQGYCQSRPISGYTSSTDTATVATWDVTPSGTITYYLFGTAPASSSGGGLDAAGVRSAIGLATANLDTQLSTLQADTDNLQTRVPAALVSGRMDASVGAYQTGLTPLQPTTAGRTLDVSATGEAGVDWANVGSPTTAVNLSATTISTSQAVASVSGAVGSVTGAVGSVTGAVGSVTGNVGGNVTGSVGSVAAGGISEASFATTAGSFAPLGIVDQGTAQAATATTLQLRSAAAFADSELIGAYVVITGGTTGAGQTAQITGYTGATDTATVPAWTTTPTGTITYKVFGHAKNLTANVTQFGGANATSSGGIPAVNTTQLAGTAQTGRDIGASVLLSNGTGTGQVSLTSGQVTVATNNDKTGYALTTAGINAILDATLSGHTTGGTVGGALNSASSAGDPWNTALPGAYAAGTAGNIIGNRIDAAITSRLAPTTAGRTLDVSVGGEAGIDWANVGSPTTAVTLSGTTVGTATTLTNAPSDSSGTTTLLSRLTATRAGYLDNLSAGAVPTAAQNAAATWDLATTGHTTGGTFGAAMQAAGSAGDPWATSLPGAYTAGSAGYILGNNLNAAISSRMATFTLPTNFSSLAITGGGAVTAGTVSDKTGYSLSQAFPSNFSSLSIDVSGRTLLQPTQTGVTIPTVTTLTNAPSDSSGVGTLLTRIGAPTDLGGGASVAANLADIEAQTDDIGAAGAGLTAADDAVMTRLGAPVGASISADVAAVPASVINSVVEPNGSVTLKCSMAAALAYSAGDLSTTGSSSTYRDPSGTATRITGTVSSPGNRLAAVTCPP